MVVLIVIKYFQGKAKSNTSPWMLSSLSIRLIKVNAVQAPVFVKRNIRNPYGNFLFKPACPFTVY